MSELPKRVLVVGPAWVGDMIMSQVIYSALRRELSDVQIDVMAPAATLPLVQRMADVDRGILLKQTHGELGLGYRRSLGRQLIGEAYDWAILTPNSLKSALVPVFAKIPKRTGFLGEFRYFLLNDIKLLDKKRLPLMTDRFLALIGKKGEDLIPPRLMIDETNQQLMVRKLELNQHRPVVGFCPGAEFGGAKKWPEAHYAELGRLLIARGFQIWVFGSPADEVTGDEICEQIGSHAINLAGKTSLPDAVDLLALCDRIVSNDSGLMHMAAAVGKPVVAIYGSTSPGFTPPIADDAQIATLNLDCSPCFKRDCPLGHKDCLNNLMPSQIEAMI